MQKNLLISRIAPTPSGYLHLGNGVNFLLTWLIVRSNGGFLHLRIDDIDTDRVKSTYIDNIFQTLEFLQIDWDGGAKSPSDYYQNYSFSKRLDFYKEKLKAFLQNSSSFYPCSCSRKDIQTNSPNGLYPKTCFQKHIKYDSKTCSIRLHVKPNSNISIKGRNGDVDKRLGDFIVWRKGDLPSYQFASLVDDERLKTTLIVRGDDLFDSSLAQLYMAKELGLKNFLKADIVHHTLFLDKDGKKLSKSIQAKPILAEKNKQKIYKEAAKLLQLESGAEDSLQTLQEAYHVKHPASFLPEFYVS